MKQKTLMLVLRNSMPSSIESLLKHSARPLLNEGAPGGREHVWQEPPEIPERQMPVSAPEGDSPAMAQAGAAWLGAAHGKGLGGQELDRRQRVPWQQGRTAASRAL